MADTATSSKRKKFRIKFNRKTIIIIVLALLLISQVERFITQGSILGYQVKGGASSATSTQSKTGTKNNEACKQVTQKDVKAVLGADVQQTGGAGSDRSREGAGTIVSCTYRTAGRPIRLVTVLINDTNDQAAAKKLLESAGKRKNSEKITKLGDEAVFVATNNQLVVRKGKKVVTINVTRAREKGQISSKDAAVKLAPKAL